MMQDNDLWGKSQDFFGGGKGKSGGRNRRKSPFFGAKSEEKPHFAQVVFFFIITYKVVFVRFHVFAPGGPRRIDRGRP